MYLILFENGNFIHLHNFVSKFMPKENTHEKMKAKYMLKTSK